MKKQYLSWLLIVLMITSVHISVAAVTTVDGIGAGTSTDVGVRSIGGTTTLDHIITKEFSAGWGVGGVITDGGSNTVNVATGHGLIRSADNSDATLYHVTWAGVNGLSVPVDESRYIVLYYNAGNPVIQALSSEPSNNNTYIYLGEVHNVAGVMDIHVDPRPISDMANRIMKWNEELIGTRVASGETVTQPANPTRRLAVTAGNTWDRFYRNINTPVFSSISSVGNTWTNYYHSATPGAWNKETAQSRWENTKYRNSFGNLTTMTDGYFANRWIVRGFNGNIAVIYGENEYASLNNAQAEGTPAQRPEELNEHGYYIAQLSFAKSAGSGAITSIKPTLAGGAAASAAVTIHNNLAGLNDGNYKHLTNSEYTGTGFGTFARYSTPTFKSPVLGAASGSSIIVSGKGVFNSVSTIYLKTNTRAIFNNTSTSGTTKISRTGTGTIYVTNTAPTITSGVFNNMSASGTLKIALSHSGLSNLSSDSHSQYPLSAGRSGGQTITGGTGASNNLNLKSTSNTTKGKIVFGNTSSVFDETNSHLGLGTPTPEFQLDLSKSTSGVVDGGIIARGTYGSGDTLTTVGAGTRFIWYPKKAALRAGYVSGTRWDDISIGNYSIAMGMDSYATADWSLAMGLGATTTGHSSAAICRGCVVSGAWGAGQFGGNGGNVSGQTSVNLGGEANSNAGAQSVIAGGVSNVITGGTSGGIYNSIGSKTTNDYDAIIGSRYGYLTGARSFANVYANTLLTIPRDNVFIIYGETGYEKRLGVQTIDPHSTLHVQGSFAGAFSTYSSSAARKLLISDFMLACHTKTALTIKLPAAFRNRTGFGNIGRIYKLKKTTNNTNKIFLNATTGQTIDSTFSSYSGLDTFNESIELVSDGVGWKIFGSY